MSKLIQKYLRRVCQSLNLVAHLTAENVALRQQLIVLQRSKKRPQLKDRDRLFWVFLSQTWSGWRNVLLIVQPETVIRWHRKAFSESGHTHFSESGHTHF
jgi:putative transposase